MGRIFERLRLTPGPIFAIELLTAARRARYFVIRALYAILLLAILAFIYAETFRWQEVSIQSIATFSASFFNTFAVLQLLAVVLVGPAMAAGTIAMERERRTIEYLFATPLNNAEIVLGKLSARVLQIIYLLLAGVPVLAGAMLLGGIPPQALLVLLVITLSTVASVAAVSVAISVWSVRARDAVVRTYLVLFVLLALPPMLYWMPGLWTIVTWILAPLIAANPFVAFFEILSWSGVKTVSPWEVLWLLIRNQSLAAVLAVTAGTLAVRRVHLKQLGAAPRRRWRLRWQLFRPHIGTGPMMWKEIFAEPASSRLGWIGYGALGIILLALAWATVYNYMEGIRMASGRMGKDYAMYAVIMGTVVSCGGLLLLAARSACSITSEKERHCWDSLLATPLTPREIINAKVGGNLWALRGVLAILALLWLPALTLLPEFLIAIPFLLGTLMILAVFASALGVSISLRAKNSLRAMALTLTIGVICGGVYLFCCMPMMIGWGGSGAEIMLTPCIPFLLAFPGVVAVEGFPSSRHEMGVTPAYVIGVIAYFIAACVLHLWAIDRFDDAAGRTRYDFFRPPRPRPLVKPAAQTPIVAELVAEPVEEP